MSKAYRLSILALLFLRGHAQTVSPLAVLADPLPHCEDRAIRFTVAQPQDLHGYRWQVSPVKDISTSLSADSTIFTVIFGLPITYTVSVTAVDTVPYAGQKVVSIGRNALAAFNASLMTQGFPNELYLTNFSSNSTDFTWRFSDGSVTSTPDVQRTYPGSGSYSVELVAKGAGGCNDSLGYSFYISDSSGVSLPNVFTPNADGVNDVYRPTARGILYLKARVFNRDQHMLYEWDRLNGSWDGRTTSGLECPDGVYSIVVEAIGFDDKKYSLKGHVTLIR